MNKAIRGKKLTSREAARVLGVSEASIKRWADSGLLPMEKTAGGHRRFRPEDVAVVRRAGLSRTEPRGLKNRTMGELSTRTIAQKEIPPEVEASLLEQTFRALLDGRDEELLALLVNLHLQGQTIAGIADRFVCHSMRRIGELWHWGELSVAQEHVATRTALSVSRKLEMVINARVDPQAMALCCSVEGDFHELPVRLASLTLEAGGFEVFDIGVNTPFSALTEALDRFQPRLICVSSTMLVNLDRAASEYPELHQKAQRQRTSIVLGGAGFANTLGRNRFPADLHAESFRELEDFIRTIDT